MDELLNTDPSRRAPLSGAERARRYRAQKARRAETQILEDANRGSGSWRIRENLRIPGEISPMVDAQTIAEAVKVAREWGTFLLLRMDEVFPRGATLRSAEKIVYEAWVRHGCPMMTKSGFKDSRYGVPKDYPASRPPFEIAWVCLEGSDEIIVPLADEHGNCCKCNSCLGKQQVSVQSKQMAEDLRTQQIQHDADTLAKLRHENNLPIWQP
jgi:hypothetical protein